jgi:hypothetical protein
MKYFVVAISLLLFAVIEPLALEADPAIEDLKWVAFIAKGEATFTFPASKKQTWSWNNPETPDEHLEYSWNVTIGDDNSGFDFGPALFKPEGSQTASGSLSDLLNACQHHLWRVSENGGTNVGEFGHVKLEDGKVRLTISDPELLEQLFGTKPNTVHMMINTPDFMIRQKVLISYERIDRDFHDTIHPKEIR